MVISRQRRRHPITGAGNDQQRQAEERHQQERATDEQRHKQERADDARKEEERRAEEKHQQLRRYFRNARALLANDMCVFPLNTDAQSVGTLLKLATAPNMCGFLRNLLAGIENTRLAVADFKERAHDYLTEDQRAHVAGKIGEDAESAGLAGVNHNHIYILNRRCFDVGNENTPPGWKARGY